MIDLQTVLTYLTLISVPIGVFYHVMTLRNTRRNQELTRISQNHALVTRQAQLFMNLFESFRSLEFRKLWHKVMIYDWKDFDDWIERFNERTNPDAIASFTSVMAFFDGIGVLLKEGLIDSKLVYELMAPTILVTWSRYEPIIIGDKEYFQTPDFWGGFEYLYSKIVEIREDSDLLRKSRGGQFFKIVEDQNTPTSL